jgi:iron complex transport system substrate-binding protein
MPMTSTRARVADRLRGFVPTKGVSRRDLFGATFASVVLLACRHNADSREAGTPSKTITNRFGTYQIPVEAQRLLLMGNRFDLEVAVALGLTPIAMGQEYAFKGGPAEHVAPWVPYIPTGEEIFEARSAEIEYLLRLRPDLILCQGQHLDSTSYRNYNSLSAVAPIVPTNLVAWREDLEQVAGWLGREARLAETFRQYDALRDDIKRRHASRIARARVAFGSLEPPNLLLRSLNDPHGPAARALADLGGQFLAPSVPERTSRPGFYEIGMENLREMAPADAILLWAPTEEVRSAFLANPLWPLLPAVQAGRAIVSTNNVGQGSVYTVMECLRLWDQVYSALA